MVVYGKLVQGKWKRKYCSAATRRFSDYWKSHPLAFLCVRVFISSTFWLLQFNVLSTMNRLMVFGFSLFLQNKCCSVSLRCCYIVYSFCPNFEQCTYYIGKKRVRHWKVTASFLQWARQKSFQKIFLLTKWNVINISFSLSLLFFNSSPILDFCVCFSVFDGFFNILHFYCPTQSIWASVYSCVLYLCCDFVFVWANHIGSKQKNEEDVSHLCPIQFVLLLL